MIKSLGALSFLSGGLLTLTIVLGLIAASTVVNAEDTAVSNVSISVPVACELNADVEEAHNATINPGTYEDEIGTTTFTVFCNDNSGFSIYAIGYSNDEYGNNKLLATIGGTLNPTYDIITGTGTNVTTSGGVSNWAMKINKVTGTYAPTITGETGGDTEDFTDYHAVPDIYTKVATLTSNTDATIGSKLQSTYAAYISGTQPAGTYNGKVKYTLVHPNNKTPQDGPQDCPANKICYFPGANDVVGVMDTYQDVAASVTLWASNFSREGYGFAGWSTTFDYSDSTGFYGPMETIELATSDYTNKGLSLYAHWIPAETGVTMQTFNPTASPYSTMDNGAVVALTDARDNDTYAVAKLADGKWWMIENLRLDAEDSTDESKSQGFEGAFIGLANPEAPWPRDSIDPNSLYTADTTSTTLNIISGDNVAYRFPRYNNQNTSSRIQSNYTSDGNVYSYGNYYTWAAAMANTGNITIAAASDLAGSSICPSSWRLPYGRDEGNGDTPVGFYYLNYKINGDDNVTDSIASNLIRKYPNNFVYTGYVYTGIVYRRGTHSYYWSSTAGNNTGAYGLNLDSAGVYPGNNADYKKYYGRAIRCVVGS